MVDNKLHQSNRICYGGFITENFDVASAAKSRLEPDTRVRVFYDPERPQESVLIQGYVGAKIGAIAFPLAFMFFAWTLIALRIGFQADLHNWEDSTWQMIEVVKE